MPISPDKNRNVPDIQARFARLGVITNILRNSEERARYDVGTRVDYGASVHQADR